MNREIKFRSFDKILKIMIPQHEMSCYKDFKQFGRVDTLEGFLKNPEYEVMQFTGLKDKNGKEIYEFDVIKIYWTSNDPTYEKISYDKEFGYWKYGEAPICELSEEWNNFEVVGNIYENAELLENN